MYTNKGNSYYYVTKMPITQGPTSLSFYGATIIMMPQESPAVIMKLADRVLRTGVRPSKAA